MFSSGNLTSAGAHVAISFLAGEQIKRHKTVGLTLPEFKLNKPYFIIYNFIFTTKS